MMKNNFNKHLLFARRIVIYLTFLCFFLSSSIAQIEDNIDNQNQHNLVTIKWSAVPNVSGYQIQIFDSDQTLIETQNVQDNLFDWLGANPGSYTYQVASLDSLGRPGEFSPQGNIQITKVQIRIERPQLEMTKTSLIFSFKENKFVTQYELHIETDEEVPTTLHQEKSKLPIFTIPIKKFQDYSRIKWYAKVFLTSNQILLFQGIANLPNLGTGITLLTPIDREALKPQMHYQFSWQQKKPAPLYHLNLWKTKPFKSKLVTIKTNNLFFKVPHAYFQNSQEINWNVTGITNQKKVLSQTNKLFILEGDRSPIKLLGPDHQKTFVPPEMVTLSWEPRPEVLNYRVVMTSGSKVLLDKTTAKNTVSLSTKMPKGQQIIQWRVSSTNETTPMTSETRKIIIAPTRIKKFKRIGTLSTFFTMSKGTFSETADGASIASNQDSPVTLGGAYSYQFKEKSSVSASLYFSKLDGSIYNEEKISIPPEYGLNAYYNHMFRNFPVVPYLGLDHERFSTYNTDELPLGYTLKTREHNITYLTLGAYKVFKIKRKNLLLKTSFSKSLHSFSSPDSLVTSETFGGFKYIFYSSMDLSRRWSVHFLYKVHLLEGPTDLTIHRMGFGVGYRIF